VCSLRQKKAWEQTNKFSYSNFELSSPIDSYQHRILQCFTLSFSSWVYSVYITTWKSLISQHYLIFHVSTRGVKKDWDRLLNLKCLSVAVLKRRVCHFMKVHYFQRPTLTNATHKNKILTIYSDKKELFFYTCFEFEGKTNLTRSYFSIETYTNIKRKI